MTLILLILLVAVIVLIFAALYSPSSSSDKVTGVSMFDDDKQNGTQEDTTNLNKQIGGLREEISKEKENFVDLKAQFDQAKKREEELIKEKKAGAIDQGSYNNMKAELSKIKSTLAEKDKAVDDQFSFNLKMKNELDDKTKDLEALKNENRTLTDSVRKLESESTVQRQKVEEQVKIIAGMEKSQDQSNWISKVEYEKVKAELDVKNKELAKLEPENTQPDEQEKPKEDVPSQVQPEQELKAQVESVKEAQPKEQAPQQVQPEQEKSEQEEPKQEPPVDDPKPESLS